MSTEQTPQKVNLPSLADLNKDVEQAFKSDQFKLLLNQQPKASWLKKHPMATKKVTTGNTTQTVPAEYLPIDKVEFLLDRIFQEWRVEVLREGVMMNSVYVTVRVHYKNPLNYEWSFHDGVGAKDVQLDAGSTSSDLSKIKASAVMMALPSAKSYAIKDACEHLGILFGRNVNRADTVEFTGSYTKPKPPEDKSDSRMILLLQNCKTRKDLEKLKKDLVGEDQMKLYDELYKKLL